MLFETPRLPDVLYDVLVIGGGITGCGIALDAQSRGMKVALLEMQDFAAGTSSRSTKLIHGGLRYLKQVEFKIVAETGRERAIVYHNGLHITTAQPMLLPIVKGGSLNPLTTNVALWVYDLLAGVPKAERRKMLSVTETLHKEPLLRKDNLLGGAFYYEYRTDDARLTIEVLKKAVELGAEARNYTKVIGFLFEGKKICGVTVQDELSGQSYDVRAKQVVNATGPWVDALDQLSNPDKPSKITASKGVHIVVDYKRLPLQQSVYFDVPDGRMVFAIPRAGKTYIGTTDTFYNGNTHHPEIMKEDIEYLLAATNNVFPEAHLGIKDVESGWAGLRPLIRQTGKYGASEISRKDEIFQYETGLLTIAGGKLTGYRKMAERIVNILANRLEKAENTSFLPCQTKKLLLSGAIAGEQADFDAFVITHTRKAVQEGWDKAEAEKIIRLYGTNATKVLENAERWNAVLGLKKALFCELMYGIDYEFVQKPADFFTRRTARTYFDINFVYNNKSDVFDFMSDLMDWSSEQKHKYKDEFEDELKAVLPEFGFK